MYGKVSASLLGFFALLRIMVRCKTKKLVDCRATRLNEVNWLHFHTLVQESSNTLWLLKTHLSVSAASPAFHQIYY